MKTKIWPRYEGSVSDSGYPTRDVVKTASPEILLRAPKDVPWKMGPFRIVKVAGSYEGAVCRYLVCRGRSCCRGVLFDTVARDRARRVDATLAKGLPVLGRRAVGLKARENIFKIYDCRISS